MQRPHRGRKSSSAFNLSYRWTRASLPRDALLFEQFAEAIRVVGDQTVDTEVDQSTHLGAIIDRPCEHLELEGMRLIDALACETLCVRGPDRASGCLYEFGHRSPVVGKVQSRVPWRTAARVRLDRVEVRLFGRETGGPDLGCHLSCENQGAPIERMQGGPPG